MNFLLAAMLTLPALAQNKPASLEPKAVAQLIQKQQAVVVDVREASERAEVVPGASWTAYSALSDEKGWSLFKQSLSKEKTIILHCRSGRRAQAVAQRLAGEGYQAAFFEGPAQWKKAGLKLEKGSVAK